jgi:hypothetical protein
MDDRARTIRDFPTILKGRGGGRAFEWRIFLLESAVIIGAGGDIFGRAKHPSLRHSQERIVKCAREKAPETNPAWGVTVCDN